MSSELATLAEWRQRFGGDVTTWTDPVHGRPYDVSLAKFAYLEGNDDVLITIGWRYTPDKPIPEEYRHLFPPATKEQLARGRIRRS